MGNNTLHPVTSLLLGVGWVGMFEIVSAGSTLYKELGSCVPRSLEARGALLCLPPHGLFLSLACFAAQLPRGVLNFVARVSRSAPCSSPCTRIQVAFTKRLKEPHPSKGR